MATDDEHLKTTLATFRRSEKRSELFSWLVEHHDDLLKAVGGGRVDWRTAAEWFKGIGLTDATGKPASPQRARATWYNVRQFVAKRRVGRAPLRPGKAAAPRPPAAVQRPVPETTRPGTPTTRGSDAPQGAPSAATLAEIERIREKLRTRGY
jgi:hypothetical protein